MQLVEFSSDKDESIDILDVHKSQENEKVEFFWYYHFMPKSFLSLFDLKFQSNIETKYIFVISSSRGID